jgi:hypothetical protein
MVTFVCLLQMESGTQKYVFSGQQTINRNQRLLFQQMCPSMFSLNMCLGKHIILCKNSNFLVSVVESEENDVPYRRRFSCWDFVTFLFALYSPKNSNMQTEKFIAGIKVTEAVQKITELWSNNKEN